MEFETKPKGGFGIGISLKVQPRRPVPIHYYREKQLETEVVCSNCTLRYSVYGVFAFCPDCGQHNSLQILDKNLEVIGKMLDLATGAQKGVAERLIENALEDCVSAFDGFGREICRVHANVSTDSTKVDRVSFQNLVGAKQKVSALFSLDLAAGLTDDEWKVAVLAFQKRHVLSHNMGVIDTEYVRKSGDALAVVGRKVNIDAGEVRVLGKIISKLGRYLSEAMKRIGS